MSSSLSPFRWAEFPRPSIFATDPAFCKGASSGKTINAIQTEAVERFAARTGRSAGTIAGISVSADRHMEESQYRRARRA